jgi:hypothetical protein
MVSKPPTPTPRSQIDAAWALAEAGKLGEAIDALIAVAGLLVTIEKEVGGRTSVTKELRKEINRRIDTIVKTNPNFDYPAHIRKISKKK